MELLNSSYQFIMIQRAINFDGFDVVEMVQKKYGMNRFVDTVKQSRNLGKKAANYWSLRPGIDRNLTRTFQEKRIWERF